MCSARRFKVALESVKNTFRQLNIGLRIGAAAASAGLFNWAWTMGESGEYLAAIVTVLVAVAFACVAVYGWPGIQGQPRVTKGIKLVLLVATFIWACFSVLVTLVKRGDKSWTQIKWDNLSTGASYLANLGVTRHLIWTSIFVVLAFLIGRYVRGNGYGQTLSKVSLHAIAKQDKEDISKAVVVQWINVRHWSEQSGPFVTFTVSIFNGSVYSINIDVDTSGYALLANRRLKDRVEVENDPVRNLPHAEPGNLNLTVTLDAEESKRIEEATEKEFFSFTIKIWITGGEDNPEIGRKMLTLPAINKYGGRP
jgi:hypothetical protein